MRIIPTGRPGATGPAGPTGPAGFGIPAYGEEIISGNAVATALPVQNTFVQVKDGWADDEVLNVTQDAVNGTLSPDFVGEYFTACTIAFTAGFLDTIEFQLFKDGVAIPDHKAITWIDTAIFPNTVSITGIDRIAAGKVIDLRVRNVTSPGHDVTVTDVNFSIFKIAP